MHAHKYIHKGTHRHSQRHTRTHIRRLNCSKILLLTQKNPAFSALPLRVIWHMVMYIHIKFYQKNITMGQITLPRFTLRFHGLGHEGKIMVIMYIYLAENKSKFLDFNILSVAQPQGHPGTNHTLKVCLDQTRVHVYTYTTLYLHNIPCMHLHRTSFFFLIKLICVFSFTFSYENIASLLHLYVSIIQSSLVITLSMSKNPFT